MRNESIAELYRILKEHASAHEKYAPYNYSFDYEMQLEMVRNAMEELYKEMLNKEKSNNGGK
tara:strand:+ start:156 stop:341 length:186 start_codon:yes stop_codon:yes gene_type:complete